MNKLYSILFLLSPLLGFSESLCHSIALNVTNLEITNTQIEDVDFVRVDYNNAINIGQNGWPALPYLSLTFALPYNAKNIEIKDVIISSPKEKYLINKIEPFFCHPTDDKIYHCNLKEYYDNIKEPILSYVDISHIEDFKGINKIVSVGILPIDYYADKDLIYLYENISFRISYDIDGNKPLNSLLTKEYIGSEYFKQDLRALNMLVVNREMINDFSKSSIIINEEKVGQTAIFPDSIPAYEYTIVTNRLLLEPFQRLVALKKVQGLDAGIVCIEDILRCTKYRMGDTVSHINDDAGKLKAYFMDKKATIRFILLGGVPPAIPIRFGYGAAALGENYDRSIPTDLYYGTDNINWDYDNDGIYGEFGNGMGYTSIFKIGRLLCRTKEDVNNYLDKLEIFELNPGLGDISYFNNAYTHYSKDLKANVISSDGQSLVNTISSKFNNYVLEVNDSVQTGNYHLGAHVINMLNSNHYYFIDINGHGDPSGISVEDHLRNRYIVYGINALDAERGYLKPEEGNGLDNLNNFGYPNILYSQGCTTIPFDIYMPDDSVNTCFDPKYRNLSKKLGESFLHGKNYGGVAFVGNTRVGYTGISNVLEKYFFEYIDSISDTGGNIYIGDAINYSKIKSITNSSSRGYYHFVSLCNNLIGDPAIKIWGGRTVPDSSNPVDTIIRKPNQLKIVLKVTPNETTTISIIDRGGNFQKFTSLTNDTCYLNVPTSFRALYVSDSRYLPYRSDVNLTKNMEITDPCYYYGKEITIGLPSIQSLNNKTKFNSYTVSTFDATGNVQLNRGAALLANSKVTIITPRVCTFNGIEVQNNAKLIVYADTIVINQSIATELAQGKIEIHGYNKYGINQTQSPNYIKSLSDSYEPLLAEGKVWKYTSVAHWWYTDPEWEYWEDHKIKGELLYKYELRGTRDIEGKSYYNLYKVYDTEYNGGEISSYYDPEIPAAYIYEDTSEGKVLIMPNCEDEYPKCPVKMDSWFHANNNNPIVLYDFHNPNNDYVSDLCSYRGETAIDTESGTHKGYTYEEYMDKETFYVIQSIGLIGPHPDFNCRGGDLLGMTYNEYTSLNFITYFPYLYEVCDKEGNILYKNDEASPGWPERILGLTNVRISPKFFYDGVNIFLCGVKPGTTTALYTIQGQLVMKYNSHNEKLEISTSDLKPGMYILQSGTFVKKFAIE